MMEQFTSYLITFALGIIGTMVGWFIKKNMIIKSKSNEARDERLINLFEKNIPASRVKHQVNY